MAATSYLHTCAYTVIRIYCQCPRRSVDAKEKRQCANSLRGRRGARHPARQVTGFCWYARGAPARSRRI